MRNAEISRKTAETEILLSLNLDGKGNSEINSGCGFLDHMLTLFSKHAKFDLNINCKGDTYVDYHHTTEDIAIALGKAFKSALADKKGIERYADTCLPMDECLILSAASPNAPTPGRIILSAFFITSLSLVTTVSTPIILSELQSEKRFPTP